MAFFIRNISKWRLHNQENVTLENEARKNVNCSDFDLTASNSPVGQDGKHRCSLSVTLQATKPLTGGRKDLHLNCYNRFLKSNLTSACCILSS